MTIMIGRCRIRSSERTCEQSRRAVAVLHQKDASAAPELIEPDAEGGGKAHLLLSGGAHQHLVGEHLQPGEILHPRDERDVVDGLGEEVVGSCLQSLHPVRGLIESGDHDHRDVLRARLRFEPAADLEAVHPRHHHVEQHHVGTLARADMQRLGTAARRAHLKIFSREPRFEQLHIGIDIDDDENACGHGLATVPRR
jgi:hypothetical protein